MSACGEIFDITNNTFTWEIYFGTIEIKSSLFLITAVYDCDTFKVLDNADSVSHIYTNSQVTL